MTDISIVTALWAFFFGKMEMHDTRRVLAVGEAISDYSLDLSVAKCYRRQVCEKDQIKHEKSFEHENLRENASMYTEYHLASTSGALACDGTINRPPMTLGDFSASTGLACHGGRQYLPMPVLAFLIWACASDPEPKYLATTILSSCRWIIED